MGTLDDGLQSESCDRIIIDDKRISKMVDFKQMYVFAKGGKQFFKSPVKPYKHQTEALAFMEKKRKRGDNFAGLFMEMGTGKTKVMLSWIDYLFRIKQLKSVLILCPLSVIYTWQEQIKLHAPHMINSENENIQIATGTVKQKTKAFNWFVPQDKLKIVITNYETMLSLFKLKDPRNLLSEVTWIPDMLILDESTRVKTPKAQTTKIVTALATHIKHRYILTGMPVTRSPFDLYSQLKILSNRIWNGRTLTAFRRRYADTMWNGTYDQILQYKNLDELQKTVESCSFVATKESAKLDLPEKVYIKRSGELSEEQTKAYRMAARANALWIKSAGDDVPLNTVITRVLKMQQIISGFAYYESEAKRKSVTYKGSVKLLLLNDLLDEIDSEDQIIIWCLFKEEIVMIQNLLEKLKTANDNDYKYKHITIQGGQSKDQREITLNEFKNKKFRILVAQVASACYGLNLTNARYAIYFSNTYNFEHRVQSEDRIHRIGQDQTCYYIDLIIPNTVDDLLQLNHKMKRELIKLVMLDRDKELQITEDTMDDLKNHFEEWK